MKTIVKQRNRLLHQQTTCENCNIIFSFYRRKIRRSFCSMACRAQSQWNTPKVKITKIEESGMWKEYWNTKLYHYPLRRLSIKDYEEFDTAFNNQLFISNKA